jgi:hypothetical protein
MKQRYFLEWKPATYYIVVLCIFSTLILPSCRKQSKPKLPAGPPPPDLSDCTHIELRYFPSKFKYYIPNNKPRDFFSPEEVNDVESLGPTVINDPEIIKALAYDVNQGTFDVYFEGRLATLHTVNIIGYRNGEFETAFLKSNDRIYTGTEIYTFKNAVWPSLEKLKSQSFKSKIAILKLRNKCGSNMERLHVNMIHRHPLTQMKQYPVPSKWCDTIMRNRDNSFGSDEEMSDTFKCPAVDEGNCHYAMNPNCKPYSRLDTVLLFETKAGWNQNGGPELFTFDNHDPKGGCVLLNDGTEKFIRTEEELQQLRWK